MEKLLATFMSPPLRPDGYQSLIPVVMAGIIAVYSLVIAVLIAGDMDPGKPYSLFEYVYHTEIQAGLKTEKALMESSGFMHLGAGLSVGLTGLAAGYAIGTVGDMVSLSITNV